MFAGGSVGEFAVAGGGSTLQSIRLTCRSAPLMAKPMTPGSSVRRSPSWFENTCEHEQDTMNRDHEHTNTSTPAQTNTDRHRRRARTAQQVTRENTTNTVFPATIDTQQRTTNNTQPRSPAQHNATQHATKKHGTAPHGTARHGTSTKRQRTTTTVRRNNTVASQLTNTNKPATSHASRVTCFESPVTCRHALQVTGHARVTSDKCVDIQTHNTHTHTHKHTPRSK